MGTALGGPSEPFPGRPHPQAGCAPTNAPRLRAEVSGRAPPAVAATTAPRPQRRRDCRDSYYYFRYKDARQPAPRPLPPAPPPPGAPRPPGPIHCGGGAGSAGRGAEMGAPPPPPPARALPQDGAGQAAALAVRGQGGPGGRPGRRLGARGAARAQPAAAGPRRGLRGQRRGPEVGARARGPRGPPGGALLLCRSHPAPAPLGCTRRVACSPGKGGRGRRPGCPL